MEAHEARLGVIQMLARQDPRGHVGRTKLMKYMYFLQTLRNVPLGYRFSMYAYGPFDSDVLSDLDLADAIRLTESHTVAYPGGYGYEIRPRNSSEEYENRAIEEFPDLKTSIAWVVGYFGKDNSSEVELLSTIIYVYRELQDEGQSCNHSELVQRVRAIKPHFSKEKVETSIERLRSDQVLS